MTTLSGPTVYIFVVAQALVDVVFALFLLAIILDIAKHHR